MTTPPLDETKPAASNGDVVLYTSDDAKPRDSRISNEVEAAQAMRVIESLFPKHLTDRKQCKRPPFQPTTWTEVDQLQIDRFAKGQFIPAVKQRLEGSFTAEDAAEYLFSVEIENCVPNTHGHTVYAIFGVDALQPAPTPAEARLRWEEHEIGPTQLVALVPRHDKTPPWVIQVGANDILVLAFDPGLFPAVRSAPKPLPSYFDEWERRLREGLPVPWTLVERFNVSGPNECRTVYLHEGDDRSVRLERSSQPCR
jgi:hypothetical protein